jgi:hypothetical protein
MYTYTYTDMVEELERRVCDKILAPGSRMAWPDVSKVCEEESGAV